MHPHPSSYYDSSMTHHYDSSMTRKPGMDSCTRIREHLAMGVPGGSGAVVGFAIIFNPAAHYVAAGDETVALPLYVQ